MRRQCAALNITPEQLFAGQEPSDEDDEPAAHELWPEHWPAWQVYLGVGSQWRLAIGMGAALWQAPSYVEVERVMARYRVPEEDQDLTFRLYQVLESEALRTMNEKLKD